MEGDESFQVDNTMAQQVLTAASIVSYETILTDNPADYMDRLAEFGLDEPSLIVSITYADGQAATLRIGNQAQGEETYYYMTIDGDERLLGLDAGTVTSLAIERYLLHAVEQPVIHGDRLDRITLTTTDSTLSWALNGAITDPDAIDRWVMTSPFTYPADGEQMESLQSRLEMLRLGAYFGPATPENLSSCGLDASVMTIVLHMAEGNMGTVSTDGVYDVTQWPESEVTLTVGSPYADLIDYVRYNDDIYLMSRVFLLPLMLVTETSTLNRYPILTTLSNLETLTVTTQEGSVIYQVTRAPQLDENGDAVVDDSGSLIYESTVTRNGEAIIWDAFENAYSHLLLVTMSGTLPEGWETTEAAHTTLTFRTITGADHTIALFSFDAMHDAVMVDGTMLFYLIHGALDFTP